MNSLILGLIAETSIHPGAGQSAGFVDLPVAREAATDYPVIVGSSAKGALLDMARDCGVDEPTRKRVFGEQENAGALLVSDLRLLLLPVRSLKSQYKWVTCPHLVERLSRDCSRANCLTATPTACAPSDDWVSHLRTNLDSALPSAPKYLGANDDELFLEERQFQFGSELPPNLVARIASLLKHDESRKRLPQQLVVISDRDFAWFARFGLAINARNRLDPDTKTTTGGGLWYEETIPPDSVFYGLLAERGAGALKTVTAMFAQRPYLQVGGNETVGQGWFAVTVLNGNGGEA